MVMEMVAREIPSADGFRRMLDLTANPESVLREVLARDEFRDTPIQTLLDRLNEALFSAIQEMLSWISRHWPKIGPLPEGYGVLWTLIGMAFYATILGLVIAGIVLLFQQFILPRLGGSPTATSDDPSLPTDRRQSEPPSREAAMALALQGRYRDALMVLFRFVLAKLHERGIVKLRPSWTNREILNQVPAEDLLKLPLTEMTTQFNAVRYGGISCAKEDFDRYLKLAEQLTRGD